MAEVLHIAPPVEDEEEFESEPVATADDYRQWWERGNELYRYMRRMPRSEISQAGMGEMRKRLLDRWTRPDVEGGVQPADTVKGEVDEYTYGNLLTWVQNAETIIHICASLKEESSSEQRFGSTQEDPNTLGLVPNVGRMPAYQENWHWPWIEGWDNPKTRNDLEHQLDPPKKKGKLWKKIALIGAVGAGAFIAKRKFFGKKKPAMNPGMPPPQALPNPQEPPSE